MEIYVLFVKQLLIVSKNGICSVYLLVSYKIIKMKTEKTLSVLITSPGAGGPSVGLGPGDTRPAGPLSLGHPQKLSQSSGGRGRAAAD